ncbi:WD40 repeat domain-containing serine/threonine protein kinase [Rhodopirellula sallentina]|uniref:Serine/threonine protein kinase n=1 Tax=Rhodopirellula sallentina SM41 TaxID=1263870 RepID=M5UGC0_9BACT|nr:WD40 repeat domain-containing serine/threonine-protein kinase [Rhodopirellula sallentina]EMI56886.1 serine/threonine protein kinase [Rhodopirellula sallentina SM41]
MSDRSLYKEAQSLFDRVSEKPEQEQSAFLDEQCGDDHELYEYVLGLIRSARANAKAPIFGSPDSTPRTATEEGLVKVGPHNLTDLDSLLGKQLGDYQIVEFVGRGGMGSVYRARQLSANRDVAIKFIRAVAGAADERITRFRTEVEAAASLDHPEIVPVYDARIEEDFCFFSMKLVEGNDLAHRSRQQRFSPLDAARLLRRVAEAVQYAHERGIIHRDIKPGNILIDADGKPLVSDFGLAKFVDSGVDITVTGQVLGTPSYMSPEQALGLQVTHSTDIYSLGAVLYCLLTGDAPCAGMPTPQAHDSIKSIRDFDKNLPRDLDAICQTCLRWDRDDRYKSAQALANDLGRFLDGRPIHARRTNTIGRLHKWSRRRPLAASTLLLILFLVLLTPILWGNWQRLTGRLSQLERERKRDADRVAVIEQSALEKSMLADERLHEAAKADYRRFIREAHEHWKNNRPEQATQALKACPEIVRGWEWDYLNSQCNSARQTLADGNHRRLAFNDDGTWIALVGGGSSIFVHDALSGARLMELRQISFSTAYSQVHFLDNDRLIKEDPRRLNVWDTRTEQIELSLTLTDELVSLAVSPDKSLIAGCFQTKTTLWDSTTGDVAVEFPTDLFPTDVAFCQDGRVAIVGRDAVGPVLHFRDVSSGELQSENRLPGPARVAIASQRGDFLAVATDEELICWVADAAPVILWRTPLRGVQSLAFRESGAVLAAGGDFGINCYSLRTRGLVRTYRGEEVKQVAFVPRSDQLVSIGRREGVRRWTTPSTQCRRDFAFHVGCLDQSGNRFAAGIPGMGDLHVIDFDRDYEFASGSGGSRLIEIESGRDATSIRVGQPVPSDAMIHARAISFAMDPQGKRVATANQSVVIWNALDGSRQKTLGEAARGISVIEFSEDGKLLAACEEQRVRIWDLETESELGPIEFAGSALVFSGSERLAIIERPSNRYPGAQPESSVSEFDPRTGKQLNQFRQSHREESLCLAYDEGGRRLAIGDSAGGVSVWSTTSGELEQRSKTHDVGTVGIAYSPDGDRLFTADRSGEIKLWDAADLSELISLQRSPGQQTVATVAERDGKNRLSFSLDGSRLCHWDNSIRQIWEIIKPNQEPGTENPFRLVDEGAEQLRHNDSIPDVFRERVEACRKEFPGYPVIYGTVRVEGNTSPTDIAAQMSIEDDGTFACSVADLDDPIGFRKHGYDPIDLIPSDFGSEIVAVGEVLMTPVESSESAAVIGQVSSGISGIRSLSIHCTLGPINSPRGRTDPNSHQPRAIRIKTDDHGKFQIEDLSPASHLVSISGVRYRPKYLPLHLKPGQTIDLGEITLDRPKSVVLEYTFLQNGRVDRETIQRRPVTLGETWRPLPNEQGWEIGFGQHNEAVMLSTNYPRIIELGQTSLENAWVKTRNDAGHRKTMTLIDGSVVAVVYEERTLLIKATISPATDDEREAAFRRFTSTQPFTSIDFQEDGPLANDRFGRRGNRDGVFFVESQRGWQAWNELRAKGGAFAVKGRFDSESPGAWLVTVTNPKTKRGVALAVHNDGRLILGPSPFDKTMTPTRILAQLNRDQVEGFHVIGFTVQKNRFELFWDGKSICEPVSLDYDLLPCVVAIGSRGRGLAEFEQIHYWQQN